jgi:hypothetical protein
LIRFGLSHHTLHMASDIKIGRRLLLGSARREATVTRIDRAFVANPVDGIVMSGGLEWTSGTPSTSRFWLSKTGNTVVMHTAEEYTEWGLVRHIRNKLKPQTDVLENMT